MADKLVVVKLETLRMLLDRAELSCEFDKTRKSPDYYEGCEQIVNKAFEDAETIYRVLAQVVME